MKEVTNRYNINQSNTNFKHKGENIHHNTEMDTDINKHDRTNTPLFIECGLS